jgi:carboxypeptidase D
MRFLLDLVRGVWGTRKRSARARHARRRTLRDGRTRWTRFERLEDRHMLSWTVLVYLDGDNNLDPFGVLNVNQMEQVGSTSDLNIVVQYDRASSSSWTETRRARIVQDSNTSTMTSFTAPNYTSMGEVNMGLPSSLTAFIQWGVATYPADHYLLDLWDHGSGLGGICWDDTNGSNYLTIKQVGQAIANSGQHIDIVGFDACLMSMVEIAHEVRGSADYVLASEEDIPDVGWPYDAWLADLKAAPSMTAAQLAADVVQKYGAYYDPRQSDTTLSALGLANQPALANALDALAQTAIASAEWATITAARNAAHNYQANDYLDLGTFLQYARDHGSDPELVAAAGAALTAYQAYVIANYSGSAANGTGASIYLPRQGGTVRSTYTASNFLFVADTHWREFLTAYTSNAPSQYFQVTSSTPAAGAAVGAAPVDFTLRLSFAYAPASVQASDLTVNSLPADSVILVDANTLRFHYSAAPTPTVGDYTMSMAAGAVLRQSNGEGIRAWSAGFRYGVQQISVSPPSLTATAMLNGTAIVPLDVGNAGNWPLQWTSSTNLTAYASSDSDQAGGPAYSWIDITSTGTLMPGLGDDTNTGPYPLGFSFPFYGQNFSAVRVCSNGFLSFTDTANAFENTTLPNTSAPRNLVALAWDDMNGSNGGSVYYKQTDAETFVVEFLNVPYFSNNSKKLTAEAIFKADGTITLQYQRVDIPNSTTVGIQDSTGTKGLQVAYNNSYLHAGLAVRIAPSIGWLSLAPAVATTAAGSATHATATFNAAGLATGTYTTTLTFNSDAPSQPVVQVPVTLNVTTSAPLSVNIVPAALSEGSGMITGQATVALTSALASDLTVQLVSSRTDELTVPATVVLPAGAASAPFDLTLLDDGVLDGVQTVTVTASAPGYTAGSDSVQVSDIQTALLTVTLPATASEGAGLLAGAGRVTASAAPVNDFVITLASSNPAALAVPATVTLRANQTSATFDLTLPDDQVIDDGHTVTVTAHVNNWTDGAATVQVEDANHTLSLALPASVYENDAVQSGAGTVTLGGTLAYDLIVSLTSGSAASLVVPPTVTVPAGQLSATFDLTPVDNALFDGARNVSVTAMAPGLPSATRSMAVADDDVHHFDFSAIAAPQQASVPFNATVLAKDVNGVTISNYNGVAGLSAAGEQGAAPITISGPRLPQGPAAQWVVPAPGPGVKGLGAYHSYASLTNDLNAYAAAHPDICRLYTIGTSVQGRDLWALEITQNPGTEADKPEFFYASTMHGDERVGMEMSLYLIDYLLNGYGVNPRVTSLVNSTEIWVLPLANPDGSEANTRENAHGVDLNRNFPEGGPSNNLGNIFSGPAINTSGLEPETAALMQFNAAHRFVASANFHTGALVVNYPYDNDGLGSVNSPCPDDALFRQMALTYSSHNAPMYNSTQFTHGITNGAAWYAVLGGLQDWSYRYMGDNAVTIELSNTFQPPAAQLPTLWDDNRESMLSFMETVNELGVRGVVTDAQTGRPLSAQVLVQGNSQPVFTDPDVGDFHRMLLPGTYTITISAQGYNSRTIPNVAVFSSSTTRLDVGLLSLAGGVAFSNGSWSGSVAVNKLDTNVRLTAVDSQGPSGSSNAFNVVSGAMDHFAFGPVPSPQYANYPVPVTITAQDVNNYTVAGYTGTAGLWGQASSATSTVSVGTGAGTWNNPLHTSWHDSRTQVIYLAGELGGARHFTSLALNVTTLPGQALNNWTVRMKHTALASYSTNALENTGWTTVYQGNVSISAAGWTTFTFTTPFAYDGSRNLMIDFSQNNASYTTDGRVGSTLTLVTRSVCANSDSTNGDPLNWTGTTGPTTYGSATVPNLRLTANNVSIAPAVTGSFVAGVWNGNVTLTQGQTGFRLAVSGGGYTGVSNAFDVLPYAPPTVAAPASASPASVDGSSAQLSVLGADFDTGEPSLTYTWTTVTWPAGAALPTFSVNGANAAKSTVATFTKAGDYVLRATLADPIGLTASSDVAVTVDQRLTAIAVSPASATLAAGTTQQFTALAADQFGAPLSPQPEFAWSATAGAISAAGLLTAPNTSQTSIVRAASGGTSGSATVHFVPDYQAPSAIMLHAGAYARTTAVDSITIQFSERVAGFDLADLALTRNQGANLLTGGESFSTTDQRTWVLAGLAGLTGAEGAYTLTLNAAVAGIADVAGNPMTRPAICDWVVDGLVQIVPGTAGADTVRIGSHPADAAQADVQVNAGPAYQVTLAAMSRLVVQGAAGDDQLTVDFSGAAPVPANGLVFDGGEQSDRLVVEGTAGNQAVVLENAKVKLNGVEVIATAGVESFTLNVGAQGGIPSAASGLLKTGPGTLIMSGTNDYVGSTTVNAGTVLVTSASAMPERSSLSIAAGAQLVLAIGLTQASAVSAAVATPAQDTVVGTLRVPDSAGWLGRRSEVAHWGRSDRASTGSVESAALGELVPMSQPRSVASATPPLAPRTLDAVLRTMPRRVAAAVLRSALPCDEATDGRRDGKRREARFQAVDLVLTEGW